MFGTMTTHVPVALPHATTIPEVLLMRAADTPDALSHHVRGTHLTWSTLLDGAARAATTYRHHGVKPGDICAVALQTSAEFLYAFFGAQLIGAVPVAINPKFTPAQIRRRVDDIGCAATVASRTLLESPAGVAAFDGLRALVPHDALCASPAMPPSAMAVSGPDDLSHLQLTSGTTGSPRAAMLRHRNVMAAVGNAFEYLEPVTSDIFVGWLPLYHDLGLIRFVMESMYFGCPAYLIEPSMPTLPSWLETIGEVGGTITAAPDFAYRLAVRLVAPDRVNLRSLRIATNGGEVVRTSTIDAFETTFDIPGRTRPGYGLAETTLGVATTTARDERRVDATGAVSCGRPRADVRIVDADGRPQAAGERGRILVSGDIVFAGYLRDPEGTAEVLKDGWLDTGDDGALDADGNLYVHGRRRAMIKRAGATIAPREIEEIIDDMTHVRRSAAVGVVTGDDAATEQVVLVVEVERQTTADEKAALRADILAAVRASVGFLPHDVVFVAPGAIPRSPTGKIQYDTLKQTLGEQLSAG